MAAGDRLLVHLNSSYSTACPGDTQANPYSFNVPVEEPEPSVRDATSQKQEAETLEFEAYRRVQVVRLKQ